MANKTQSIHNENEAETIDIYLSPERFPITFESKVLELMDDGLTRKEAERFVYRTPFVMELYYSTNQGLFLVESEAVGCISIYDPYTGVKLDQAD